MFEKIRWIFGFATILFFGNVLFADLPQAEQQEINNYRLTEKKMVQFGDATKRLLAEYHKNPELFKDREDDEENDTLASVIEATDRIPAAKKAISDAGMTSKEYWLFQMATVYAASGHMAVKAGGKIPDGFSKENIDFYSAHEAEFQKLGDDIKALQKLYDDSSDGNEDEDEEDEEDSTDDEGWH